MKKENKIDRSKVMKALMIFNQKNGIAFLSKKEAEEYYKNLVDLIIKLTL